MSAHPFSNPSILRRSGPGLSLMLALAVSPAMAAPKASGDAYDLSINVSILTAIPALVVSPQAQVGFAPQAGPFNDSATAGPLNLGNTPAAPLITLQTGLLNANTAWYPPATPNGFMIVGSEASAANVDLGAVNPSAVSLLDVTADLVRTRAVISGYCPPAAVAKAARLTASFGDLAAEVLYGNGFDNDNLNNGTGHNGAGGGNNSGGDDSTNPNANVSVTGTSVGTLPINPLANTQTCILGGAACVKLNEMTVTGDGVTTLSVSRNGLHLTANVPGVVTAEVILAHAAAAVVCN